MKGKKSRIQIRANELIRPIDQQIMMCDSREETLLFACILLEKAKTIFEANLGKSGRREIFSMKMGDER